ncbi:MAG: biopolymer transporter ExbD [Rhodocyclaceae bacterium]|nr:biopolymer transporter ExbD [Rhodocyclaceae bacterium]
MNFQRGGGMGDGESDEPFINVIPLIDVIMVILIFLMLTTTFTKVASLEIDLPKGAETSEKQAPPQDITISVSAKGVVVVNTLAVGGAGDVPAIERAITRAVRADNPDPVIVISADAKAAHQRVIDVMQAAQNAGLHRITFAVSDEKGR